MKPTLRALIIEDDVSDAGLLERHLQRGGFIATVGRVDNAKDLEASLQGDDWDLVISDYHLPGFDALTALAMVRRHADLPFIVVSGQIGEERAVELMRAGANDYVMKDRLARLVPVIERELSEAARRREHRRVDAAMKAQEARFQLALKATGDGVWDWNPQTGATMLSPELKRMLGYAPDELASDMSEWRSRIHPDDLERVDDEERRHYSGASTMFRCELRLRRKDGSWIWVLDRGVVIERDELGRPTREIGTMTDITEARHNEEAARASHETLQKLSRQVPGMLYQFQIHPDGRMTVPFVSDGLRTLFEYERADIGDDASPLMERVHPEDRERFAASIQRSAENLGTWVNVYRLVRPINGVCWVHGEAQPERLADGSILWHGLVRDITEYRNSEALLRLLQACIHHVNDAVLITEAEPVDGSGPVIVYANPAFERQTGYRLAEVIGKTPRILQGPDTDRATLDELHVLLRNRQPARVELLNYRKSGEPFWSELEIAPVADGSGYFTHWVSVQRDVTARKVADAERERLIQELKTRNDELDAYNYSVAHDLRNPVISIRGLADLATRAIDADQQERARECIGRIAGTADRADTLIRSLMELAKLGKRATRLEQIPLRQAVASIVGDIAMSTAVAKASYTLDIADALVVHADESLLVVILGNLVDNAIKYRHPDRVPAIRISASRTLTPDGVEIRVADNGIGIDPEAHRRVFELFERLNEASPGTGIGLTLVERAARVLGGHARLHASEPGAGSCFGVWLPAPLMRA